MKKNLLALLGLYTFQFLFSACDCNCPPVKTFNSVYTSFDLQSWDTSGFNNMETENKAYKNAFGLSIYLNYSDEEATSTTMNTNLSGFGFSSAYAWSCDCPFDNYIIQDPIVDIDIFVTNAITNERINITQNFESSNYYDDTKITVKELFQDLDRRNDNFRFDLVEFDNVPDSAVFTISILLDSGKELTQNTGKIEFL